MRIAILELSDAQHAPELSLALRRNEMEVLHFSTKDAPDTWSACDGYILIGSGRVTITAQALTALKTHSARGKPLLGIGDAASVLVEHGFVPGLEEDRVAIQLKPSSQTAETTYIRLSPDYQYNAFTRYLTPQHILTMTQNTPPTRFVIPPGLLTEITIHGLNVFCYCNAKGEIHPQESIAAVSNKAGNVMAMLPQPEKTLESDAIFISMRDHIASGYVATLTPLDYWPR